MACGCSTPTITATSRPEWIEVRIRPGGRPRPSGLLKLLAVPLWKQSYVQPRHLHQRVHSIVVARRPERGQDHGRRLPADWHLEGLPFVGREWELEHRHNTFNRLLQTLRAPDFVNVAFWVHDIRRRRTLKGRSNYKQRFNQDVSDQYMGMLSSQRIMQNELYLTMIYRPVVAGKLSSRSRRTWTSCAPSRSRQ